MNLETISMAVDPFAGKPKGSSPERIGEVDIENDPLVEKTFEAYNSLDLGFSTLEKNCKRVFQLQLDVLNPVQIDKVLQRIIMHGEKEQREITGFFLSKLMQNSYYEGYTDFTLTTTDEGISHLGYDLKGNPNRKLNVHVMGNTDTHFGFLSEYCLFTLEGSTGNLCGADSNSSSFLIKGNTGHWCGYQSKQSLFTLGRSTGDWCGNYSNESSFFVQEDAGNDCGNQSKYGNYVIQGGIGKRPGSYSEGNTFTTSNIQTYRKMKENVPRNSFFFFKTRNKVIYKPK